MLAESQQAFLKQNCTTGTAKPFLELNLSSVYTVTGDDRATGIRDFPYFAYKEDTMKTTDAWNPDWNCVVTACTRQSRPGRRTTLAAMASVMLMLLTWCSMVNAGITYRNSGSQPITIGVVTVFDNRHLYEDCWHTIAPGASLRIGNGAFADRVYWIVVKRSGAAIAFGRSNWSRAEASLAYLHPGPNSGELWQSHGRGGIPYDFVARDLVAGNWYSFTSQSESRFGDLSRLGTPKPYPALRIAGYGTAGSLTFHDFGWSLTTSAGTNVSGSYVNPYRLGGRSRGFDEEPQSVDESVLLLPQEMEDIAFEKYVDLRDVGNSINSGQVGDIIDLAMGLAVGERVLLRIHKSGITARGLLERATRLASDRQDQEQLARLKKAADELQLKDLAAQVESASKVTGASRSADPALIVSLDRSDLTSTLDIKQVLELVKTAELLSDASLLDTAEAQLAELTEIPGEILTATKRRIATAREVMGANLEKNQTEEAIALRKLAASSRDVGPTPAQLADRERERQRRWEQAHRELMQRLEREVAAQKAKDAQEKAAAKEAARRAQEEHMKRLRDELRREMLKDQIKRANSRGVDTIDEPQSLVDPDMYEDDASTEPVGSTGEIIDPAFNRFVDLSQVRNTISTRDASQLAEIGLQLKSAEQALQREHRSGVKSNEIIMLAAKLAARTNDQATQERVAKAIAGLGDVELSKRLSLEGKIEGTSRGSKGSDSVSLETTDAEAIHDLVSFRDAIDHAELLDDSGQLDLLEWSLNDNTTLSPVHKAILVGRLAGARESVASSTVLDVGSANDRFANVAKLMGNSRRWGLPELNSRVPIQRPVNGTVSATVEILVDGKPLSFVSTTGARFAVASSNLASTDRKVSFPRLGTEYAIRITNPGPLRILAVVSVDGLSVMDGKPSREADSGYIIGARESYTITGWRIDQQKVKSFIVTPPGESEAAKQGLAKHVGQIHVTAIQEYVPPAVYHHDWHLRSGGPISLSRLSEPAGTGAGRELDSAVTTVEFRRSSSAARLQIRYDVAKSGEVR